MDHAIKSERKGTECEDVSWIHVAQVGGQLWYVVTLVSNLVFPYKNENIFVRT
jgi:hypothetical protein